MTIKIYPSAMDGEPLETHQIKAPILFADWLREKAPAFTVERDHPIGVCLDGTDLRPDKWETTEITPGCCVEIRVEPKGSAIILAAAAVVSAVVAYVMARSKKPPKAPSTGQAMGESSVLANTVTFGDPIPEIAGSPLSYPCYLLPPATRYEGLRTQWVSTLLCIGKGEYAVGLSDVFVGDTPATRLGSDVEVEFFGPGEVITGNPAAEWWHSPEEVGFTTFGGSGMTLGRAYGTDPFWPDNGFTVSGKTITGAIPPPMGQDGWSIGTALAISVSHDMTFGADWVSSELFDSIGVSVGHTVKIERSEIDSDSESFFVISVSSADPGEEVKYTLSGAAFEIGTYRASASCLERPYVITGASGSTLTVTVQGDPGWVGFPAGSTLEMGVFADPSSLSSGWTGPFRATPGNEQANAIEVDIFMPDGIAYYKKNGHGKTTTAGGAIQWRYLGGQWNNVPFSVSMQSQDQIGFTYRVNLPEPGRVEVRVRSDVDASTSSRVVNKQQWTGLRARILGAPTRYEGMTTMSIRLRTGDNISGAVENKISVRARRKLPTLRNPAVMATTTDIAPFFLYILESVGYGRDVIDMDQLNALHEVWSLRADRFDLAIASESTLKTVANYCLSAGFAEMTLSGGLITPVRDAMRHGPPNRIFSPQEYTAQLEEVTETIKRDDVDGVDVEYLDYRTGRTMTEKFRLPGDLGHRVETIKAPGVTGRTLAWRQAARRRRVLAYRRTQYQGATELQAMNANYMDFVGLQDGIPEYGQSAFVVAVTADGLTAILSEEIEHPDGFLVAAIRKPDGTATLPALVSLALDGRTLTFSELPPGVVLSTGENGAEATVIYLGARQMLMHDALMTEVRPSADGRVTFIATRYDERVYYDDDSGPDRDILTSQVYPVEISEGVAGGLELSGIRKRTLNLYCTPEPDSISSTIKLTGIRKRSAFIEHDVPVESINVGFMLGRITKKNLAPEIYEENKLSTTFTIEGIAKRKRLDSVDEKPGNIEAGLKLTEIRKRKISLTYNDEIKKIENSFLLTKILKVNPND